MNSRLLRPICQLKSLFCLPFIFVIVVVFRVFIPVVPIPSFLFLLIKTYKVSSCVSLAPAI